MSIRPALLKRAGSAAGLRLTGVPLAIFALSLAGTSSLSAAEKPQDVLQKMADLYNKAKSYQATVSIAQSGKDPSGKAASVNRTEKIQFAGPNKFHVIVTQSGTGSVAKQVSLANGEATCDGKSAYTYSSQLKQYAKSPAPPTIKLAQVFRLLSQVPPMNTPGLTLLPAPATIQGRSAYVVEIKPVMPPNLNAQQKQQFQTFVKKIKQPVHFYIDRANYQLLQVSQSTSDSSVQVNVTSQTLDASIPESAFTFNPPAGAKEYVAPKVPSGGVPGVPGGPGGGVPGGPGGNPKQ